LARISSLLQSFADSVDPRVDLSLEERLDLPTTCVLAKKLYTVFNVAKDVED
jgi:hypothetical protein